MVNLIKNKFHGGEEIETRRHVRENKVMIGKFYSDNYMIAAFIADSRVFNPEVTYKEYKGYDEVAAAKKLLEEQLVDDTDFSFLFA
jgi:hypothetical protein